MIPWQSQIETAIKGFAVLKEYGLVYIAGEERTGKLLASVLIAEMCPTIENILVLTTKKALKGWNDTLSQYSCIKIIRVTNYHQAVKLTNSYDLIILDECHNYLPGYPIPSGIWKAVRKLTKNKPIIYTSATPHAQGRQMLFHQFNLSDYSPWKHYRDFYHWFRHYGIENYIWLNGREVAQYNKADEDRIKSEVDMLFVTQTRQVLGFPHEPIDKLHYIELSEATKNTYNELLKHKVYKFSTGEKIVADTQIKLRVVLHQIEGGAVKITYLIGKPTIKILANMEKIDYIKATWGDADDVVIMYQYKADKLKLEQHFKHATLLQATSNAEGIDLSHKEHLIIYSQDFSASKHSQRRARQANRFRKNEIIVHFLLVKKAISEQVYNVVSINKVNFVDSVFQRETI